MSESTLLDYSPQPKQLLLHNTTAKQILFGGAAGGGKSHCMRWDAIIFCLRNPGITALLLRRSFPELETNHIVPMQREMPQSLGQYISSKNTFIFSNGSRLVFGHMENRSDYLRYQGGEYAWIGFDEAALFDPIQIIEVRSRLRLGSLQSKVVDKQHLPRVVFASNPGGPSHDFLKRIFIDGKKPMELSHDETLKDPFNPEDKGWPSIYIPSRMMDNKYLDTGYAAVFSAMSPERASALRDGKWDAIEGAALHSLDEARHKIRLFPIPTYWLKFCSMDWGTAKPFSVGWYTVASEDVAVHNNNHLLATELNPRRTIIVPKGAVIRYAEYYGWTGKDDEGVRLDSATVSREILRRERERNDTIDYYTGDSAMYNQHDGPSPAEKMYTTSEGKIMIKTFKKDRKANYDEILARLAGNPYLLQNGEQEQHPLLFFTDNCVQAWRTLPILVSDVLNPDKGPGERQEDHIYDEIAYAMSSRPIVVTRQDRDDSLRRIRGSRSGHDPYSTK